MKIIVDGRVLTHKKTTGVEIHAVNLIKELEKYIDLDIARPKFYNKYYAHFWEHFILPILALRYDILFCPSNIAPIFLSRRVKLIHTLHDISFMDIPENYSNLFQKYYSFFIKL